MKEQVVPVSDWSNIEVARFVSGVGADLPELDALTRDVFEFLAPQVAVTVTVVPPFPVGAAFFREPIDHRESAAPFETSSTSEQRPSSEESTRYWAAVGAPCAVLVDDGKAGRNEWVSRSVLVDPPHASAAAEQLIVWVTYDDWAELAGALREVTDAWPGHRSPAVPVRELPVALQSFFRRRLGAALRDYQRHVYPHVLETESR